MTFNIRRIIQIYLYKSVPFLIELSDRVDGTKTIIIPCAMNTFLTRQMTRKSKSCHAIPSHRQIIRESKKFGDLLPSSDIAKLSDATNRKQWPRDKARESNDAASKKKRHLLAFRIHRYIILHRAKLRYKVNMILSSSARLRNPIVQRLGTFALRPTA